MEEKEKFLKVLIRRIFIFKNFVISGLKIIIFKPYWKDFYVSLVLFVSLILNLINWTYLYLNRIEGDYPVILHYNLFFGVDFLGSYNLVFFIPLIGLILFAVNSFLSNFLYKEEKLAAYFLTLNIFFIQSLLLLSGYLIVAVNS